MSDFVGELTILSLPNATIDDAYKCADWCDRQFGKGTEWQMQNGVPTFYFTDPEHVTIFLLTFGHYKQR